MSRFPVTRLSQTARFTTWLRLVTPPCPIVGIMRFDPAIRDTVQSLPSGRIKAWAFPAAWPDWDSFFFFWRSRVVVAARLGGT